MKKTFHAGRVAVAMAMAVALGACKSNEPKPEAPKAEAASASQPAPAAAPAQAVSTACQDKAAQAQAKTGDKKTEKTTKAGAKNTKGQTAGKSTKGKTEASETPKADECASEAAATAKEAPAKEAVKSPGAYDLSKNKPVTDSTKVQSGEGTMVKGLNDWEGEITGIPAANSKFTKLKIGMPLQQAFDLAGQPTDQGAYVTGKAFIPWYFGSDRTRWEAVYKGQGRLIFANQAGFGTGQYLIWIIHNSNEGGYR